MSHMSLVQYKSKGESNKNVYGRPEELSRVGINTNYIFTPRQVAITDDTSY